MTIKKKLYEARTKVAKALAHETRLEIVDILKEKEAQCVCELTEILRVSQSSVSKHLGILKNAGIVDFRKEGLNVCYYLRTPCVANFFTCLDRIIEEDFKKMKEQLDFMEG
ncbi:MAG: winged helix-turn-helix transcriptional regulator [Firmicutes bacterium]|nr:winged helix-turn-helix transcriptional regulator [Bacillota bacterium]